MRLQGYVRVMDYSKNIQIQNRISVCSLYYANGEDILFLQARGYNTGVKYKLSPENVLQVSYGVMCKRCLTITMKEPPHELRLNNHMILVQNFGNLVRFLSRSVEPEERERPCGIQRQMEEFNNIPLNLKILKLHHIEMDYLPDSIARLEQLSHLEVVNANLAVIPMFVGWLPFLTILNLSRNRLGIESNWDFLATPFMRENLRQLNLQNNEIQTLPLEMFHLQRLWVLHMDYNLLASLPNALLLMRNLRVFSASYNRMRTFPYNLFPLATFSMDLLNNPFISHFFVTPNTPKIHDVPSLKELAARAVTNHCLPLELYILPKTVLDYLDKMEFCEMCGGAYFEKFIPCRFIAYSRIYAEIVPGREYLHSMIDVRNVCSRRCMRPELKSCEVLDHLTPEEYELMVDHFC